MKTFKNFDAFKKRIQSAPAWDDYFTMDGRMYKLYEYGDLTHGNYVYFVNKKTHDAIRVEYVCPSYQWRDGVKVQTAHYRFIEAEFIEDMDLWRTDTL